MIWDCLRSLLLSFILLQSCFFFVFCQDIELVEAASEEYREISVEEECLVLTLETALSRALNYNRQLMDTIDTTIRAQYGIALAESEFNIQVTPNGRAGYVGGGSAGTGPSLGVGLDFNKKFPTGTQIAIGPYVSKINKHYRTDLNLTISQPLLSGFGCKYQLSNFKGAQFAFRSACRTLYMNQLQLVMRTISALYDVVKAQKAVALSEESYQRVKQFYQTAKLKECIGLSDALDVYRAEIEMRHSQDNLTNVQEGLQEKEDVLKDLLALPLGTRMRIDVSLIYTENSVSLDEAIQLALKNRIEMDQAKDQWWESRRLSHLVKDRFYPDLNLVLNYSNCGFDQVFARSCTRHRESSWGIGLTSSSDFNPVGDQIAYEQSLIAIQAAGRGIEQTKVAISLEIKRSLRQLQRAYKRIDLQKQQIKTAQGELQLSQLKFNRCLADNFNIIQAEQSLRMAELSYWTALIDHIIGEYQFLAAIGLLTDKPHIP